MFLIAGCRPWEIYRVGDRCVSQYMFPGKYFKEKKKREKEKKKAARAGGVGREARRNGINERAV